ncbi:putative (di)nucleoside polyphosphate hydrolase [Pseudooceanicola antarcticus]|uniref:RNA pyrophosphohydrolase n=1 Tax=Pseudooceanicola antarcticus TaxID=1247613 RepID=A0A285I0Z7_9RHOB|nr:RNA pyrophosphohydrolase [Pseudooceanicola antarcticus]PJE30254.1 RNA pyrophosphohydrolase [Pseudooceanicola antarcticus]SNY41660.1 putative (di)nucleoside polyphosphate hydrolase [Pseudooceanicola antarcticus]
MTPDEKSALPYRACVGVVLVNSEGQVFTGQRLDSEVAAWQMPQGGIDPGETPQEAALRELWEETGVQAEKVTVEAETEEWIPYDLPDHLLGKVWGGKYRGQEQKWVLMRFHGTDADVNIATEHPEFSEWRWMPPQDLVENIVPFKRAVYARVLELLGDRL